MARWQLSTLGKVVIGLTQPLATSSDEPATTERAALSGDYPDVSPRALALLAVVAAAGERGVSRERLLLYFWPDNKVERARNALRQTLFRLRRDLDEPELVVGTTALCLNPQVITCDAAEFEQALDTGSLEEAAALYGGPFLHGVVVGDAPELDEWVSAERERLARRFAAAVEALASAAESRADREAAVGWWRKLAVAEPTNARVTLELRTALASLCERERALQYCRLHESLVQEELGVAPDETSTTLVERLQQPTLVDEPTANPAERAPAPDALAAVDKRRASRGAKWSPWLLRLRVPALLAAALVLTTTLWLRSRAASGAETPNNPLASQTSGKVIAVFPFTGPSDGATTGTQRIGDQLAAVLSALVDGAGGVHVIDAGTIRGTISEQHRQGDNSVDVKEAETVAQRVAAEGFVLGEVVASGSTLRVIAALHRLPHDLNAPPAQFMANGDTAHIDALAEELAKQIVVGMHPEPAEHLARVAADGTQSFAAFKAYVDGEYRLAHGEYGRAVDDFQRAAAMDSNFALAWYRLAVAADWGSRAESFDLAATRAERLSDRLHVRDRMLLRAFVAWHRGDANEAERLYRILVTQYPDDAEAWYQLCETRFHLGPVFGRSVFDAQNSCERALTLRPGDREPLVHLLRLAAKAGDERRVDTLARQLLSTATPSDSVAVTTLRAFAVGDSAASERALIQLGRSADETVLHAAIKVAVYAEDLPGAERIARLLTDNVRGESYRRAGAAYESLLLVARGQPSAANARLEAAEMLTSAQRAGLRGMAALVPLVPHSRAQLEALRDTLRRWRPAADSGGDGLSELTSPRYRGLALGVLSVRLGDTRGAEAAARELDRDAATPKLSSHERAITHDLAQVMRAEVARARGDRKEALAFASTETAPYPGLGSLEGIGGSRVYQRYLRAELLRELGQDEEALRWYASIGGVSLPELVFLAPAALRQAEILERRGDSAGARVQYRRFLRLWRDCDPDLRPIVVEAARRLGNLTSVDERATRNK